MSGNPVCRPISTGIVAVFSRAKRHVVCQAVRIIAFNIGKIKEYLVIGDAIITDLLIA
jgi:hypothetical protein